MDSPVDGQIQKQPLSKRIIRNTLYNALGAGCLMLVSLILTPYIIKNIGIEKFGIWAIANVLIAYFGFFDFSMSTPVVKYASEFHILSDSSKLNQLFNTAFVFYLCLAVATGITCFIFLKPLLNFFSIPPGIYKEALFVVGMSVVSFMLLMVFNTFNSLLVGLQYMDTTSRIVIFSSIISTIGTVYVLSNGYGLRGLSVNYLFVIFASGIISAIMAFRKLPEIRFNPFCSKASMFKLLFGFGVKLHVAKIAFLVSFQIDKILLARFLTLASVTFYELGSKIAFTIRRVSFLLVSAIVPAASEMSTTRERAAVYNFYLRCSKYLISISIPLFLFFIFNARQILFAWIGEVYIESVIVLQLLAVGYLASVFTGALATTAAGMGKPEFEMKRGLLVVPLNLALSLILIIKIGLIGACIGTMVSLVVGDVFMLKSFHAYLGRPVKDFINLIYKPFAASLLAILSSFLVHHLSVVQSPRINSIVILLLKAAIVALSYIVIIFAIRFFDGQDLDLFKKRMPVFRRLFN
ncbi:MAG: polysaccharide biosynthesis C-terminal domain-containing protein [Candidatus Omnitrophota bacterium]